MNLPEAFFDGIATRPLLKLWEAKQEKSVVESYRVWQRYSSLSIFSLITAVLLYIASEFFFREVLLAPALTFLLASALSATSAWGNSRQNAPHKVFVRDCEKLLGIASYNLFNSPDDLREDAGKTIFNIAVEICQLERSGKQFSGAHEHLRASIKHKHEVFQRFGLVEDDWTPYFKQAETHLKATALRPITAANIRT